ncbi:MAG: hypothetical protein ACREHG_01725 [Candidatus Saccharimonadales bacterium]
MRRALIDLDTWARQWRFVFNAGKCGVMVHGQKRQPDRKWMLGAAEVQEVECYKYLGMERERKKGWRKFIERAASKARSRLYQLLLVGAHQHGLRPSTGKKLAEVILRPVMEYGAEVLSTTKQQSEELERVMLSAGRLITGLPHSALCDAVRGELGWTTMAEERDSQTQVLPSTADTARWPTRQARVRAPHEGGGTDRHRQQCDRQQEAEEAEEGNRLLQ